MFHLFKLNRLGLHQVNVGHVRTYSANMFPSPMRFNSFFEKSKIHTTFFFNIKVFFFKFLHFHSTFLMRYFKMCIKNHNKNTAWVLFCICFLILNFPVPLLCQLIRFTHFICGILSQFFFLFQLVSLLHHVNKLSPYK